MMEPMPRNTAHSAAGSRQIGRADHGRSPGCSALPDHGLRDTGMLHAPFVRTGLMVSLHLLWAAIAGLVTLILGWSIAAVLAGTVPIPRRYLSAGSITTLALVAACLGPSVVEKVACLARLVAASDHIAYFRHIRTITGFERWTRRY